MLHGQAAIGARHNSVAKHPRAKLAVRVRRRVVRPGLPEAAVSWVSTFSADFDGFLPKR